MSLALVVSLGALVVPAGHVALLLAAAVLVAVGIVMDADFYACAGLALAAFASALPLGMPALARRGP